MSSLIAFLRAINVGGRNVTMEQLRGLFEQLKFKQVETFIASGNVIFTANAGDASALERKIEAHLLKALGYEVKTFIRSEAEIAGIANYKPFRPAQLASAGALNIAFLGAPLNAAALNALMALKTEIDDFHVHGREVYWLCKKKQSESKFSNAVFEKRLKLRATFRGFNTLTRLADKLANGADRSGAV